MTRLMGNTEKTWLRTGKNHKSYVQLYPGLLESWRPKLKALDYPSEYHGTSLHIAGLKYFSRLGRGYGNRLYYLCGKSVIDALNFEILYTFYSTYVFSFNTSISHMTYEWLNTVITTMDYWNQKINTSYSWTFKL